MGYTPVHIVQISNGPWVVQVYTNPNDPWAMCQSTLNILLCTMGYMPVHIVYTPHDPWLIQQFTWYTHPMAYGLYNSSPTHGQWIVHQFRAAWGFPELMPDVCQESEQIHPDFESTPSQIMTLSEPFRPKSHLWHQFQGSYCITVHIVCVSHGPWVVQWCTNTMTHGLYISTPTHGPWIVWQYDSP